MCQNFFINLNSLGLILDLIGVFLLWKFGIPNKPLPSKDWIDVGWVDEIPEKDKLKHNRGRFVRLMADHSAYVLLFLGFFAQLVSGECSQSNPFSWVDYCFKLTLDLYERLQALI